MVDMTLCFLLLCISQCLMLIDVSGAADRSNQQYYVSSRTADRSSKADEGSGSKSCRFTWEWETAVYGDICLPAKTSLLNRPKSSSIKRHRHRHKNRDHDHQPDTLTRHLKLYRGKGDSATSRSDTPLSGELSHSSYQMDSPSRYMLSVSL